VWLMQVFSMVSPWKFSISYRMSREKFVRLL
jgi:hypothetical protein